MACVALNMFMILMLSVHHQHPQQEITNKLSKYLAFRIPELKKIFTAEKMEEAF